MKPLQRLIAAHPLTEKPYSEITFSRVNHHGIPLYTVGEDPRELGAPAALQSALRQFGGLCFHCGKPMPAEALSHDRTRDHLRPKHDGGQNFLHNLVFACGSCNRLKGGADLISYRPKAGRAYMKALDEHLVRCLKVLDDS